MRKAEARPIKNLSANPDLAAHMPAIREARERMSAATILATELGLLSGQSRDQFIKSAINGCGQFQESDLPLAKVEQLRGKRSFQLLRRDESGSGQQVWCFPSLTKDELDSRWRELKKRSGRQESVTVSIPDYSPKDFEALLCRIGEDWSRSATMNSKGVVVETRHGNGVKMTLSDKGLKL